VIATDLDHGPLAKLDRPGSQAAGRRVLDGLLRSELAQRGLDFDQVIRPQLGQPLVIGITREGGPVGAIRVNDPRALRRALAKSITERKLARLDSYEGALVWRDGSGRRGSAAYGALRDSVFAVARSEAVLHEAIDAAAGSSNLAFSQTFASKLPQADAATLVRGIGAAQRVLASGDPGQAVAARKVPWVRALGLFTVTVRVKKREMGVAFELATDGARLSEDDLPLKPGAVAPRLHDPNAPAAVAVLEPARLLRFIEQVLRATDASRFDRYENGIEQLRAIFGVDFRRDLVDKLTSLSIAVASPTAVTFEAPLRRGSAADFARDLDRARPFVEGVLNDTLPGTSVQTRAGGRPTWLVKNGGVVLARYGVRDGVLVGSVGLARLPRPVRGERLRGLGGSLVMRGDIARIGRLAGFLLEIPTGTFGVIRGLGDLEIGVRTGLHGMTAKGRIRLDAKR
jgi:hypothetical protein